MTNSQFLPKQLILFGILVPLAAVIGYLLASPTEFDSVALLALIVGVMAIPIVLKWNHPLLILTWNAALYIAILPGEPFIWMGMAVVSFGLSLLNRILDKELRLVSVPSVTWTLLILVGVVVVTGKLNGWGFRALGGATQGGKKYIFILLAALGYFALSWRRIPARSANFLAGGYFLAGATSMLSNFIYMAGPGLWFLYYFIPAEWAFSQAYEDLGGEAGATRFSRLSGLSIAGQAIVPFLMMRYGLRGMLDLSRPWRILLLAGVVIATLFGGFRSAIASYVILFTVQFWLEGLFKTRLFPVMAAAAVGLVILCLPFLQYADRLPMSVQRSLSPLPIPVSNAARIDAVSSTEWRVSMWGLLVPEIPKYFWLGKGFTGSTTDYYLGMEAVRRGYSRDYELMIITGDYHNGPLSILIPFGIWGMLAFVAFLIASMRVLYLNFRYGDPGLKKINTVLYAVFVSKAIFFFFVFGAIATELAIFTGLIGLSVSINGGVARAPNPAISPAAAPSPVTPAEPQALPG